MNDKMSMLDFFLSDRWVEFLNWTTLDDRMIFVLGSVLTTVITFWTLNLFLIVANKYNWYPHLKTQPDAELPSDEVWYKVFYSILRAEFITQPIGFYFMYPLYTHYGMTIRGPFPSIFILLRDFTVCMILNDTLFYWSHRILHHKLFYKRFHKKHHTFTVNNGLSAQWAHPVEDIFANLIPTFIGALVMSSHVVVFWGWYSFRLAKAWDAHCGYNFLYSPFNWYPYLGGAALHDFHHSHNVGSYGSVTMFWDWLMGTDKEFVEFLKQKEAKRAVVKDNNNKGD